MEFDLKEEVSRLTPELIDLRRDFHQHPELAFDETRTAKIVAERLLALDLEVVTGVGKTGVVGLLPGKPGGKTVALRADIDALPITEESGRPFKSLNEGKAHACGHDGHTAAVLSVAKILAKHRDKLTHAVKFIFQPAEEIARGATLMVEEGVMRDPHVDAVLSVHLWNSLPVGTVGFRAGPIFSSVDELHIEIKGKGGHGAIPQETIDPIPIAAQVVLGLQHIVSRNISPFQPAVITIGSIQGGTTWNVIPERVSLRGTLRTYDNSLRDYLVERIEDTVRGICLAAGADYEFDDRFLSPPVDNQEAVTAAMRSLAEQAIGADNVITAEQYMTGDDVAFFNRETPGCYFLVGSANPEQGLDRPHHHPKFDFDEGALPIAVELLAKGAMEIFDGV